MTGLKRFVTIDSLAILGLFGIYVVSTPFLREPPTPVVHVTVEPQPLPDATESGDETTSGAYQTGERTGEQLNHLWQETKDFGRGLWSTLTEKE